MKKFIAIVVIALSAGLAGCATGPSFQEYSASVTATPDTHGRIYLYRPAGFVGGGIQPKIRLNGEVVGKAKPNTFVFADRPAGTYEVAVVTEVVRAIELNLRAGDEAYVRFDGSLGVLVWRIRPVLVDNTLGKAEIAKTKHLVW